MKMNDDFASVVETEELLEMSHGDAVAVDQIAALNESLKGSSAPDLHEKYSELAAGSGVCPFKVSSQMFGAGSGINEHDPSRQVFSVLNYEGVARVLTESDTFTVDSYVESLGRVMDPNVLMMDGDAHKRQRAFLNPIFGNSRLQLWNEIVVKPVIVDHLDKIAASGPTADFVDHLCLVYPFTILSELLGLPKDNLTRFHRLSSEILGSAGMEAMFAASDELGKDIRHEIARRREEPGPDLISALVAARIQEDRLSEDEIVGFLKLLFSAGAETTSRGSANLLTALLTHPDQMEAVRNDRSLIAQAIEEALRWESPVGEGSRMAVKDTQLNGVPIPAGSIVYFYEAAANRDPKMFESPEKFDIWRKSPKRHLAFGHMRHLCLGMGLSRMEITSMMNLIFDRFPKLRLDPDMPPPVVDGVNFRSPSHLWVRTD